MTLKRLADIIQLHTTQGIFSFPNEDTCLRFLTRVLMLPRAQALVMLRQS